MVRIAFLVAALIALVGVTRAQVVYESQPGLGGSSVQVVTPGAPLGPERDRDRGRGRSWGDRTLDNEDDYLDVWIETDSDRYRFDDDVTIRFESSRDARVWIFSQDETGVVRQLLPNAFNRSNVVEAGSTYRIPSRRYDLKAGPPEGRRDIIIAAIDARIADPFSSTYTRWDTRYPFPTVRNLRRTLQTLQDEAERFDSRRIRNDRDGFYFRSETRSLDRRSEWTRNRLPDSYGEARHTIRFETAYGSPDPGWDPNPVPTPPPGQIQKYGRMALTSSPTRAEVYVDGKYVGRTPLQLDLLPDRYEVLVYKPGYQNYSTTMDIRRQKLSELSVRLAPNHR